MAKTTPQQYHQLVNKPADGKRPGYRGGGKDQGKDSKGAGSGRGAGPAGGASSGGNYGGNRNNQSDSRNQGPAGGASAGGDYGGNVRADQTYAGREFRDQPFASDDSIQRAEDNLRRIQNNETKLENKDLFINKTANYGKYVPPAAQFLANFNRKPNRKFFYERVLKNNAQGLNYTELEKEYEKYMAGRMSGETDAMGRRIQNFDDGPDQPIIPLQTGIMSQAPGTTDQVADVDPNSIAGLIASRGDAFRFFADGGRAQAMDGGIMNADMIGGMMDGNMDEMGRQMYGLGKLVKKVTRGIKKVAKSPLGKIALGAAAFKFGAPFLKSEGFKNFFLKDATKKFALNNLSQKGILAAIGGTSALAGLLTQDEEEEGFPDDGRGPGLDIAGIRKDPYGAMGSAYAFYADGGDVEPVAKKTMPLIDMDGKEKDYRETGGFVDMGRMERADDVPARLSKNEFVFTADAVRNAGDGDIDKGAEVMYNMMKNLEDGGDVSEESQGLEGARKMFQTSQRLEEVL